jgi:hypothetical protein
VPRKHVQLQPRAKQAPNWMHEAHSIPHLDYAAGGDGACGLPLSPWLLAFLSPLPSLVLPFPSLAFHLSVSPEALKRARIKLSQRCLKASKLSQADFDELDDLKNPREIIARLE